MEVVEVKITNPKDREAVAKQVGEAVAKIIGQVESESKKEIDEDLKTDVDNMDDATLEAVTASDDFQAWNEQIKTKINELNELFTANRKAWNCGIIISAISICGKESAGGGMTFVGRGDAISCAIGRILDNEQLSAIVEHKQMKARALEFLAQMCDDDEGDDEGDDDKETEN